MMSMKWPFPGSRWWKFDFHTHTPKSTDTAWFKQNQNLTPGDWLLRYMAAGIDCVAVTDHNSGEWISLLNDTYETMKATAETGPPESGFRELAIFPGVELSVQGGIHMLAILDPSATTADIDTLLGRVDYQGTKGSTDGVTGKGVAEVIRAILDSDGIPIPAHADEDKGLLMVHPGSRACAHDANTVLQALALDQLLAVEWVDESNALPECTEKQAEGLAHVLGTDCHDFQGSNVPGSRFTWVKMASPTLEGLRLALLDGNGVSILRGDDASLDPLRLPAHMISAIEIEKARYVGNHVAERLAFSPYYNALIGGRGTGKSTLVHALRLALNRTDELALLDDPREQLENFCRVAVTRTDAGALRQDTEMRLDWRHDDQLYRLRWSASDQSVTVEELVDGQWQLSDSQATPANRFPVQIFSQGQIAAMAGEGRQALLDVVDEASEAQQLWSDLDEEKRSYMTVRAQLRELKGKIAARPELERRLKETVLKLRGLTKAQFAEVLNAYQESQRQGKAIGSTLETLGNWIERLREMADSLTMEDWPSELFSNDENEDVIAWRNEAEGVVTWLCEALTETATDLETKKNEFAMDKRIGAWQERTTKATLAYEEIQETLAGQDIQDLAGFHSLEQERQKLVEQIEVLDQLEKSRKEHASLAQEQQQRVWKAREAITERRSEFVRDTLAQNEFVRMEVVHIGFEPRSIERSLRELLDVMDDRFSGDILDESAEKGLAWDLASALDRTHQIQETRRRLLENDAGFHGKFRSYLERRHATPEFHDHIQCWFPEDDLRIEYSRTGDGKNWTPITQGSQGQRSAALLAFLLSFGSSPLILDQPEDDLDNHLIYDLIVRQISKDKLRRQLIIVTHNPNVLVNGDAEMIHALDFRGGQCRVVEAGGLQEATVREEVCRVMEGGREALARRWARLGKEL